MVNILICHNCNIITILNDHEFGCQYHVCPNCDSISVSKGKFDYKRIKELLNIKKSDKIMTKGEKKFNKRRMNCSHKKLKYIQTLVVETKEGKIIEQHFYCKKCFACTISRTTKHVIGVKRLW